MLELGAVALLLVASAVVLACLFIKALVWLVLFPIRLILTVPFLLLKWAFGLVGFLFSAPLLGLAVLAGLFVLTIGLLG